MSSEERMKIAIVVVQADGSYVQVSDTHPLPIS